MQTRRDSLAVEETPVAGAEETHTGAALVIEGALRPAGVALVDRGRVASSEILPAGRHGRSGLLAAVQRLVAEAGLEPGELDEVVIGTGPGSFTGFRVAASIAQGLLLASRRSLRIYHEDSLKILTAAAGADLPLTVAIPWGRLRVLLAERSARGEIVSPVRLVTRDELPLLDELSGRSIVAPAAEPPLSWPPDVRLLVARVPGVLALASLHAVRATAGGRPRLPVPAYLVPPDAVVPARSAQVPPGLTLCRLTTRHLKAVVELESSSFPDPWSSASISEELAGGTDRLALGLVDEAGAVAAAALGRRLPDALGIYRLMVASTWRTRGLARLLLRAIAAEARSAGLSRVDVEVRSGNEPAIALYRSEGFTAVGTRRGYYSDREDAIVMSLVLRRG